jgi:hypothetical protein
VFTIRRAKANNTKHETKAKATRKNDTSKKRTKFIVGARAFLDKRVANAPRDTRLLALKTSMKG